jgi:hypothetical protein
MQVSSRQERDAILAIGMESGVQEQMDRGEKLFPSLARGGGARAPSG